MASTKLRLPARDPTPQQWKFAEACLSGLNLVDAYVAAYPPRGESRSRESERVKAKRLAKNPTVVWAMQRVAQRQAEEEAVANPEKVREECLITLRRIRQGRLDSHCVRAVLAELREANREIDRREESAREQQRAQRSAYRQLVQALEVMNAVEAKGNTAESTASRASSTSTPVLPLITPAVQAQDSRPEIMATPTPQVALGMERDDEVQHLVRAQQADRAAATPKKPPQRERTYLPGHFPPQPEWNPSSLPQPRTTTLPTFTAHRTGKEVPVLRVIHERWNADIAEARARKKRKEPRQPYY
jgi:hypothetical protein